VPESCCAGRTIPWPAELDPHLVGDYTDFREAARQMRAVNRDALLAALDGVKLDHAASHIIDLLAEMGPATVGAAVALLERCRAGDGQYSRMASIRVEQLIGDELLLDASNEVDFHPIAGLLECEADHPDDPAYEDGCTVVVSAAYQKGAEHLPDSELVAVLIPVTATVDVDADGDGPVVGCECEDCEDLAAAAALAPATVTS
jgi:hypothetical protein